MTSDVKKSMEKSCVYDGKKKEVTLNKPDLVEINWSQLDPDEPSGRWFDPVRTFMSLCAFVPLQTWI